MIDCMFELNGEHMSAIRCGALSFPAFSGLDAHRNRKTFACSANTGPIPPGIYYVVDRQWGGRLGPLWDRLDDRQQWFALYADDGRIDDEMFCNRVRRGNFRLHPKGVRGISQGCITVDHISDFQTLRSLLKGQRPVPIPGSPLRAYGRVIVR